MDVRLLRLGPGHLDDVRALFADPEVLRFTRVPVPPQDGFAEEWYRGYEAGRKTGEREGFAALADGRFAGLALAPQIDPEGRQLELGYIVAPDARGQGAGTAILRRLTDWAFEELRALRAYLIIDVENAASERIATRCGYVREGVMRSFHLKQGIRIDAGLWSRLADDPPAPVAL